MKVYSWVESPDGRVVAVIRPAELFELTGFDCLLESLTGAEDDGDQVLKMPRRTGGLATYALAFPRGLSRHSAVADARRLRNIFEAGDLAALAK